MAITRVTQHMISQRSLSSLQTNLSRMAKLQEQLSSGRTLNRPSDSVSGTASAMRLRDKLATVQQYQDNAQDGLSWLGTTDTALTTISDAVREARDVGLQGANGGSLDQASRDALASQIDGLREQLVSEANTSYLGRPVFGGITSGSTAYDASGTYVGQDGAVQRTVGDGAKVRVDTDATSVFGATGSSLFDHLSALSSALRAGDIPAVTAATATIGTDADRIAVAHADVGIRYARIEQAQTGASDAELTTKTALSDVENVDLPKVTVDLQMQQVAYQASLAATARVVQPSLLDFLR